MSEAPDTRAVQQSEAPAERESEPSPRGLWALAFVVFALVALVAAPAYFDRRVDAEQTRITAVLEPAARLSSNLRLLKARQFARMEGFLASEDRAFRDPYNAAIAEEDSVLSALRVLAGDLDVDVFERVARLTDASIDWRFVNQRIFDMGVDPGARDRVVAGYEELQRATLELDRAILAQMVEGRRMVANEQRRKRTVTLALALAALVSTLLLARVAWRYRGLLIERERRRRDAVRARREIDALLEATGDGVLGVDLDGRCTSLNRAGAQLLGYTEREMLGRDVHETLFRVNGQGRPIPRDASPVITAIAKGWTLESGDGAILLRRRGIAFPARWSLRPMVDGTELRGAVLTFTDMTEIQEKEQALRRAIRQREDVVSIVSHDLRNPLGVALAAADLLLDLPLDEQQRRRQAEIIRRSGKRMQRLIEDLLDVARIEAGALVVRPSQEELEPILAEACDLYRDQAEARSIALSVVPTAEDVRARVDRDRMMQALSNLLDNAIRLTPEGGSVSLSAREEGDFVLVSVADTGPGIAEDEMERLFDRFAQGAHRDSGAAGLGLTIVRGVAGAHAGEVVVDSEPGRGSVFTLRLPKSGPPVGEEGRPAPPGS
jgi:PAS domain S-box-containing protein